MGVDTAALDLVAKMPDNDAAKWLDANIGKRDPKNPRRPMERRKP